MRIGIDGSRAFIKNRTGVEEYSYQVIRNLREKIRDHQVVLYLRREQNVDFDLPKNWKIKVIRMPLFWTQVGLSWEMAFRAPEVLFVPAHVLPFVHPKKSIVTVHGLEYEIMPEAYSFWERMYMRYSIKKSCQWAQKIISVSRNTKNDLMRVYDISEKKIFVVYEGCGSHQTISANNSYGASQEPGINVSGYKPFILFVGRLEKRKNIVGIVRAFLKTKKEHDIPHKLVLSGRPGFGFEEAENIINDSPYRNDIILTGYVSEEKKWELMRNAEIFLFPTFYEGFGLPILEAQSVGVPVITSNVSSMPEVAGDSTILVYPQEPDFISGGIIMLINDKSLRDDIINKGYGNIKRFSWDRCASLIYEHIIN